MTDTFLVALDDQDRRILAAGLDLVAERLRRDGLVPPARLTELRSWVSSAATDGQGGPMLDVLADGADHEFMKSADAARFLEISPRSLARRTADGSIPSVRIGGLRRYRRSDLEALDGS